MKERPEKLEKEIRWSIGGFDVPGGGDAALDADGLEGEKRSGRSVDAAAMAMTAAVERGRWKMPEREAIRGEIWSTPCQPKTAPWLFDSRGLRAADMFDRKQALRPSRVAINGREEGKKDKGCTR